MTLIDAGPLVALFDVADQQHAVCVSALQELHEPLATVWPPLTEAMYHLSEFPKGQEAIWEMLESGKIHILPLDSRDVSRMRELMHQYADLPMDLADAALIRVAEREGIRTIFTLDRRDFSVYRLHGRIRPHLIP